MNSCTIGMHKLPSKRLEIDSKPIVPRDKINTNKSVVPQLIRSHETLALRILMAPVHECKPTKSVKNNIISRRTVSILSWPKGFIITQKYRKYNFLFVRSVFEVLRKTYDLKLKENCTEYADNVENPAENIR